MFMIAKVRPLMAIASASKNGFAEGKLKKEYYDQVYS